MLRALRRSYIGRPILRRPLGCEGLESRLALSVTASLVADLVPSGYGSSPRGFTEWNGGLYFAHGGTDGHEPWVYDGQTVSRVTQNYRDDDAALVATEFIVFNDQLHFSAQESDDLPSLVWRFDGAQIEPVTAPRVCDHEGDCELEPLYAVATSLTVFDGKIFFSAVDTLSYEYYAGQWLPIPFLPKRELFVVENGAARIAAEIRPSPAPDGSPGPGADPRDLTVFDGALYFSADDGTTGRELWRFDGLSATRVADLVAGQVGSDPRGFAVFDSALYFSADDGVSGRELWRYDGTNLTLAADIAPNAGASSPDALREFAGRLYFAADDGLGGRELWQYDGANISLAADVAAGSANSSPTDLAVFQGVLYFSAADATSQRELWRFDGQTATLAADINSGPTGSSPHGLTAFGDALVFSADDGVEGEELWKFDGATAAQVADLAPGFLSSNPINFALFDGSAYFGAQDPSSQFGSLWGYDGAQVHRASDASPATEVGDLPRMIAYGNELVFVGSQGELWLEPFVFDGAQAMPLADLFPGINSAAPSAFTLFNGNLYFEASSPAQPCAVWKYDGSTTQPLVSSDANVCFGSYAGPMLAHEGFLYLKADVKSPFDPQLGTPIEPELWKYDGSRFSRVFASAGGNVDRLIAYGGEMYFTVYQRVSGADYTSQVWKLVGGQPIMVRDFGVGSYVFELEEYDQNLYASVRLPGYEDSLWKYDGANWTRLTPTFDHPVYRLNSLTPFAGELYFVEIGLFGEPGELWKTDGTFTGRVFSSASTGHPRPSGELFAFGDELLLAADDGQHGSELWRLSIERDGDLDCDGDADLADLARLQRRLGSTGPLPSHPADLTADGTINRADVAQWLQNFGRGMLAAPSPAAADAALMT